MNTGDLLAKYARSHFDRGEYRATMSQAQRDRARAEYNANPEACLDENVIESQGDLRATTARFFEAKTDGLFDADAFKQASKPQRATWLKCIGHVRGDFQRATAELRHWLAFKPAGEPPRRFADLVQSPPAHWSDGAGEP